MSTALCKRFVNQGCGQLNPERQVLDSKVMVAVYEYNVGDPSG